jgi:hypothetical protein
MNHWNLSRKSIKMRNRRENLKLGYKAFQDMTILSFEHATMVRFLT